ncbi:MAG: PaaI family thioesterase [Georgfuchsia sp.]
MSKSSNPPHIYDHAVWISDSPELRPAVNDNWQARRELADALRQLNMAMLTTDAPTEQLRAVATTVRAEAARILENERIYGRRAQSELIAARQQQGTDILYEMSPATGQSNAVAPAMHMWREGERVHARVTPDWCYEGPFGHLHGGVIALLFDQLLGVAQRLVGGIGHTGTLTIRFHHPTPLNETLSLVADVKRVDGRKKFMVAELWSDNVLTASCEGLFVARRTSLPPASTKTDSA